MALLEAEQIARRLAALPGWQQVGPSIRRTFAFESFPAAIRFVDGVAELAEAADHHPDIDIRYTKVALTLSTHSAGGLTMRDMDLAGRINELSP